MVRGIKKMQNRRKALSVLIAAVGINLVGGVLYCWSILSKELISSLHWTSTEASLPYTMNVLLVALFMVIGGRIRDKLGPRFSALIGGTLIGGGLFLSSFCTTSFMMMITYGLIAGGGMGFTGASTTVTAIKWFPAEKKGMISGICLAGIAFAAVYISPIIHSLIAYSNIHKTFQYIGSGAFVIIIFLALFLAEPTDTSHLPRVSVKIESEWKSILKKPNFYKLWFIYLLGASVGLIIIGNIAIIALKQAQWQNGFLLVILLAIFNGLGRFVGGTVSDKIGIKNTFGAVFIVQAVNMIFFNHYRTTALLGIGTAIAGFCYGGLIAVVPAATAGEFGTKNLGVNYGLVNTAYGFSGIFGPIMAGRIVDITGSYHLAYLASAVLLFIAVIIIFTLRQREETSA